MKDNSNLYPQAQYKVKDVILKPIQLDIQEEKIVNQQLTHIQNKQYQKLTINDLNIKFQGRDNQASDDEFQQGLQSKIIQNRTDKTLIKKQNTFNDNNLDQQQTQNNESNVINVLKMLQRPESIDTKNIRSDALEYDIKLGWVPKTQITGPIPISFNHLLLDQIIQQKMQAQTAIYLGYRPTNTFDVHKLFYEQGKKYPFYQFHLCKSLFLQRFFKKFYSDYQFTSKRPQGMIKRQNLAINNNLAFDSIYEGGNLDMVYFQDNQYKLLLRVDSNTKGHCNYYNFKVKCNKSANYRFRIMNISKKKSLYQRGMKPYIKIIDKKNKKNQDGWLQRDQYQCSHVIFLPSPFNEQYGMEGAFYSLRFNLELKNQTEYQICYGIPYVYSDLVQMINKLRQDANVHVGKLCYSLSGVEVPLLTITQNNQKSNEQQNIEVETNSPYYIVITGRIHPAECNGSHIVNGLIKQLLKDNPQIQSIRKNICFKIIPMLNPDAVIMGNTRTGFAGKDLNRKFGQNTHFIFPQVIAIRDYVIRLKQKYGSKLLFIVDIHGHSTRKGSFFFGPQYPVFDDQYTKCRMFPKMYSNRTDVFRYYSCKFKISECKQATSRGFFNSRNIRTYTHETSMHCYYDFALRKDLPFTKDKLQKLGADLLLAIHDYVKVLISYIPKKDFQEKIQQKDSDKRQSKKIPMLQIQLKVKQEEHESDKMDSDRADSQDSTDDLEGKHLNVFYQKINQNKQYFYQEILKQMKKKGKDKDVQDDKQKHKNIITLDQPQISIKQQLNKDITDRRKKVKINWASKVSYSPKKTLFEQYSSVSNVVLGRGSNYKLTNTLMPKLKMPTSTKQSKRYSLHLINQIKSNQFTRYSTPTANYLTSMPNIKWDISIVKNQNYLINDEGLIQSSKLISQNLRKINQKQIKSTQLLSDKIKGKLTKNLPKAPLAFKNNGIAEHINPPKLSINKQSLQKLLKPSQPSNNTSIISHRRSSTTVNDKYVFAMQYNTTLQAQSNMMKTKAYLRVQHKISERAEKLNEKEEILCKRWEKQIVSKIRRKSNAFKTQKLLPKLYNIKHTD